MKYGKGDNSYKPIGGRNTPTKSAKGEIRVYELDTWLAKMNNFFSKKVLSNVNPI